MAGWLKIALRSFAAAAGAGAAQLGTAGALSILSWSTVPTPEQWRRQLTWLLFIFAAAVLVGVAGGRRSVRAVRLAIANRRSPTTGRHRARDVARRVGMAATRVHATAFAALGAFTSFLLVWLPARTTLPPADVRTLALAAGIGVGIGAVAALLAMAAPPIATTVATWVGAVWIFGLTSAGVTIATNGPMAAPRLGVLDAPHLIGAHEWWLGPGIMVVYAALVAVAVAVTARRLGARPVVIGLAGLAGPGIVAAIYLTVGPGEGLLSAYVSALLAAVVGTAGALLTVDVLRRRAGTSAAPSPAPTGAATPAAPTPAPATPPATPTATPAGGSPTATTAPPPAGTNPAWQYPAATESAAAQYSANPYPTNQYPRWSADTSATPTTTAQATAAPSAAPATGATQPAGASTSTASTSTASTTTAAQSTATAATATATTASTTTASTTTASTTTASTTTASTTTAAPATEGSKRRGRAERASGTRATSASTKRAKGGAAESPPVVRPEPLGPEPSPDQTLPRTARPAQVVAVEPSRPSPTAEPTGRMSRRARRRAAKLAAAQAEEAARLAKQMAEEEKSIGKREREHIDWVKHLTEVPVDPTLLTRQK